MQKFLWKGQYLINCHFFKTIWWREGGGAVAYRGRCNSRVKGRGSVQRVRSCEKFSDMRYFRNCRRPASLPVAYVVYCSNPHGRGRGGGGSVEKLTRFATEVLCNLKPSQVNIFDTVPVVCNYIWFLLVILFNECLFMKKWNNLNNYSNIFLHL